MEEVLLPFKPSSLIEIALEDLEKAEKSKNFEIDMDEWAEMKTGMGEIDRCSVCFAGAVISQRTLKHVFDDHGIEEGVYSVDVSISKGPNSDAYIALDRVRRYAVNDALAFFHRHCQSPTMNHKIIKLYENGEGHEILYRALDGGKLCEYETNPEEFKSNMKKIAEEFKEVGL